MILARPLLLAIAGALAGALLAWQQPVEHAVRAKVATSEMSRRVELEVQAAMRKVMPAVRVDAEVQLDEASNRAHEIDFCFVSKESDPKMRAEALRVLEDVIAPHRALFARRAPILQKQMEWIEAFRKRHGDHPKVSNLLEETRARLERGPSRLLEAPSIPLARRTPIGIAAIGGALFGAVLGLLTILRLRDPIGASAIELVRRGWWWMGLGIVGGAFLGAALFDPPGPKMRAVIEAAQLDRTRPVTWADTLAGVVSEELGGGITVRWVHDLSPYLKQATLLEVIAEDRESIDRVFTFVKEREDPGIERLEKWNGERIKELEAKLAAPSDPGQFVEIAVDLANAMERNHPATPTRYLAEPWIERRASSLRPILGAALGLLAAIAIAALVGVRQ